jgi:hypothetical protein
MASRAEIRGFKLRAFVASVLIPGAGVLYALVQTRTQLRDETDDVKSGVFMAGSIWLIVQFVLLLAVLVTT